MADKSRAGFNSRWWWRAPAFVSVGIGVFPVLLGLGLASLFDRSQPNSGQFVALPLWIPIGTAVCLLAAFILFPTDVPGRANFGRLVPFLLMVSVASLAVNFALVAVCSFAALLFSAH